MREALLAAALLSVSAGIDPKLLAEPDRAQAPQNGRRLVLKYRDDDGPGRLTLISLGNGAGGASSIKVVLEQHGSRYLGSGFSQPLTAGLPARTLLAFSVASPQGAYFFRGETTSGVTLSGQGTYHRVGFPERERKWSAVLGG